MRICIDSNQFIFGISGTDASSEALMLLLPRLEVVLPRLILREVTRNLREPQVRSLYALLSKAPRLAIVDDPVPADLVVKYAGIGLPAKADALIGAFVEWQKAECLVSNNRHFLSNLTDAAFEVVTPADFIRRYLKSLRDK